MSNKIRGIIDEAEDAVDGYTVLAAAQKSRSWTSKTFFSQKLRSAGKRIELVADKVREINARNMRERIDAPQSLAIPDLVVNRPGTGMSSEVSIVEKDHVVGFETAANVVEKLLVKGLENLEVITIAGMSGLGKTTLAKMVYNDPYVDYEYEIRAFVYVSRQCDKRNVLLQILKSISMIDEMVIEMNEKFLEKHVCQQLEGKQYLIVLDNVWETEDWDALKGAFPNNNKRCRVLITTTNAGLAEYANPINPDSLYMLNLLNLPDSKELLKLKVFGKENFPDGIMQYVDQIVEKCEGLPLTIVLIAGVIRDRRDRVSWWKQVSGSVYKYLSRDASEGNEVIEMMYDHLPNKLKPCFIYLGVFREDFEIPVWKLVRLWISEGFIDGGGNNQLDLEDIAENYLEELVQRNLVMVGQRRSNGKIKTCRMHDTLRQFCKKEANEENLFQVINRRNINSNSSSLDNCRRLCINGPIIEKYMSGPVSGKRVRSFLLFQKEEYRVDLKHVPFIPKTFRLLKVLEVHDLIFTRLPPDLSHLFLLKYLAISSTISAIPSSLSSLWNLQTLIVSTTFDTLEVKMDLWKMPHFRHFHTNVTASLPSPDTKSQNLLETNVRTLSTISSECCSIEVLDRTPRLKKLGICGDLAKFFDSTGEESKFEKLNELKYLKLMIPDRISKPFKLPSLTCFPPQLTKLTLTNTRLEWKEMSTLGRLENLEVLELKYFAFQGSLWNTEEGGFNHLVHLFIGKTDLKVWGMRREHFPMLKNLELNCCDKLESFPHRLADIPTLQFVQLHCTNPRVACSARKLQVLKFKQEHETGNKNNNFRLSVYPPDH